MKVEGLKDGDGSIIDRERRPHLTRVVCTLVYICSGVEARLPFLLVRNVIEIVPVITLLLSQCRRDNQTISIVRTVWALFPMF